MTFYSIIGNFNGWAPWRMDPGVVPRQHTSRVQARLVGCEVDESGQVGRSEQGLIVLRIPSEV